MITWTVLSERESAIWRVTSIHRIEYPKNSHHDVASVLHSISSDEEEEQSQVNAPEDVLLNSISDDKWSSDDEWLLTSLFHFYYYYAVLELYFLRASFELVSVSLFIFFTLGCIVHWSSTQT